MFFRVAPEKPASVTSARNLEPRSKSLATDLVFWHPHPQDTSGWPSSLSSGIPASRRDPDSPSLCGSHGRVLLLDLHAVPQDLASLGRRSANIPHAAWWWEHFSFLKRKKKKSPMIDCVLASSSHLLLCNIDICLSTKTPSVLQTHLFHWLRRGGVF